MKHELRAENKEKEQAGLVSRPQSGDVKVV